MSEFLNQDDSFSRSLSLVQSRLKELRSTGTPNPQEYQQSDSFESNVFGWLPDFVKQGYNESVTGMARELAIGSKPFDIDNYNPSILQDIGSSMISLFMPADLLLMAGTGGAAGFALKSATKRAGRMATKQLMRSGVSKKATRAIVNGGVERVVSGATGFGAYSGVASALSQQIEGSGVDYRDVLTESAKGALLGAVTSGIGVRAGMKGSSQAARVLQEGTAFGVISPALEGRIPTPQDFVYSIGTVMGLRGAHTGLHLANRKLQGKISEKQRKELEPLAQRLATEQVQSEIKIESSSNLYKNKTNPSDIVRIASATIDKNKVKRFNLIDNKTGKKSSLQEDVFRKKYTTAADRDFLLEKYRLYEIESGYTDSQIQTNRRFATNKKMGERVRLDDMDNVQLTEYSKQITADYRIREYKKRYLDLADLPQRSFLEHVLPRPMIEWLLPARSRAKQLTSRTLIDNIEKADIATKLTFEKYQVRVDRQLSGLSETQLKQISNALEGKEKLTGDLSIKTREVRKIFDDMYEYARGKGIKVADYRADYLPQMIRRDIADIINNDIMSLVGKRAALLEVGLAEKSVSQLNKFIQRKVESEFSRESKRTIQYLVNKEGMTYYDAFKKLQNELFTQQLSPYGNLEKSRKFKLPEDILERDVLKILTSYNMKLARRVEIASRFGLKGERAEALVAEIAQKNPAEARAMNTVWSQFTGFIESDPYKNYSPTGKRLAENIMAFEMSTKIALGTATIPNLSQFTISTAMEAGYLRTLRGAIRLGSSANRKKLEATGSTYHNSLDILLGTDLNLRSREGVKKSIKQAVKNPKNSLLNISNALATLSGFKGINYANNLVAASTAEIFIKDLHKIANSSAIKARRNWANRNLKRFGIDSSKKLSQEGLSSGMYKFAKETQLQKDILSDPIFFNNPMWRPWIIFKRFGYKQANYLARTLDREVKQSGNVMVPLRLIVGGTLGGWGVEKLRSAYIKGLTGEETFIESQKGLEFVKDKLKSVGTFGVLGDILEAEDLVSSLKFTITPVILSDLEKATNGLIALQKNVETFGFGEIALRRSLKPIAPIFGTIPSRAMSGLQTPKQRLEGLKQRKSKLKIKLLDKLIKGDTDLVIKDIKQWNSKFPEAPITGYDINFQAAYERIIRKNSRVAEEEAMLKAER